MAGTVAHGEIERVRHSDTSHHWRRERPFRRDATTQEPKGLRRKGTRDSGSGKELATRMEMAR